MSYLIEDYVRLNSLFDIYQSLLTHKQQDYFKYYFREDYSLSEIAEIMNVSRNAVHLQIKKISSYLEDYESKLKLLKKQEKRETILDELLNDSSLSDDLKEKISKLEKV